MKWGPASLPAPTAPSEGSAEPMIWSQGNPTVNRLTSSGVASHQQLPPEEEPGEPYFSAPPEGPLLFRAAWPDPKVKAGRCSAALLGMTLSCVPLCLQRPESRRKPRRAVERPSLPAPRPGWPRKAPEGTPHCLPRRSDLWSPAAPSCRCRLSGEAGTAVPITRQTLNPGRESRQRKKWVQACG